MAAHKGSDTTTMSAKRPSFVDDDKELYISFKKSKVAIESKQGEEVEVEEEWEEVEVAEEEEEEVEECSKTRCDLTRMIEGNNASMHYLSWMTYEMTLSRKWKNTVSAKWEVDGPEQNPFSVPMYPMFMPTISSSSDASSPTIPPAAAPVPFRDDKGGDDLGEYELGGSGKQLGSREE